MKKIITSLILLFGVLSTLFAANVTLYYVNSTKWTTVNGYVWNKASDTPLVAWPGTAMTKTSETAKGFDVYSITFDGAKYDRIIFKGASQTADLTFNASKPYYYEGKWYATLAEINGADAPAELTLYYVNTTKWSKVLAYAWIDGGASLSAWPGAAATLAGRTKDGIEVYSYTFNPAMANKIIFNDGSDQTTDLPINAATPYFYNNNWVASFAYDPVPVEPTPVLDPIYLRGNVNAWGIDDTWKLTTTDGNYFVANYAAGSEVELSGSFKLGSGTTDWTPYNFGADIVLEAGKSYVLTAGSSSPNINTSGKIKVSKIEFTLSSQTLKITGQTVADKFDVTTDQGIALVENLDGTLQYIPLEFQANGVYTGVYTFAKSAKSMPLFKVGGTADLNTIDFGDNGTSIIRLDQPYTLKRGSSNFVAINQTDLGSQGVDNGTKFDVTVTFTEDWGVTLLFVKQADPVVTKITNLSVETFANTTVNKTSIVNASYYLYYADEAVPTISGEDAAYFTLSDITLGEEFSSQDGEPMRRGEMIITFAPTEGRQYKATLTITSGDVSESIALIATGVALPVEAITNLTIPAFASTEVYASSVVTATYTLENATQATAKLTGDNAFSIVEQTVSNGQGAVTISFTPGAAGTYSATLIITSGKASQSIDFTATATAPETDERVATLYIKEENCNPISIYVYGSETATTPEGDAKTGVKDDKLHLHGYNMYKITLNLKNTKYVSVSDKGNNKQAIEPGSTWYYDGRWNDNFDECRYDVALEDLTKQPEAGKIYAVGAYLAFYSAEYGPEFMYKADRTDYDATIKGVKYYSYNIDASLYDMARVEGGADYSIDWSKPYYYDGNWYATMAQIPVADNLVEEAKWSLGLVDASGVYPTTHMGNNIYTGKFDISIGIDKPYQWEAQIKAAPVVYHNCYEKIYADAVVPEQAGYYEVSVQYNATTNQYTAQWEFKETNVFVKFLDKTNAMEIAELNNYTFRCFTKIAKGLYYYNINDKNHDLTTEETVVQIPEDGTYNITFSYDATTGKFSHTVEKALSKEITLYYVNENTNVDCAYAFAYAWIQYSGDCVAAYPGEEMTDTGKTVDGYQVLSYTVDLAEADYILFDNTICGDKTADLAIDPAKPYYYQGEWHESLTFDEAPTGETTLYYVNKMGITDTEWDYAFAYAYDNATGTPIVSWPGIPMGKLTKTIDGYDVFACTVDLSKADYIIFTNGQGGSLSQTMDLKIEPLKPYYYQLIWHGKLTFDDGTTEPGEILDPVLPDHEPIYLRGVVNNWGVDENYKLTSIDGIRYSVTYAPGSEIELYGNFKLASGNDTWYPFNFGAYPTQPIITAGQDFVALRDASDNIQVDGKILVSKIEFNLDTYTLKITGETQKFDMTSDQGVSVVVYVGEESTFIPLTFTQNGTYTGSFTVTDADFSLKIAGTSDYNTINYGTNGTSAKFAYLYALQQGAFESITIDDEYEVGDVINVWVAFEEDWSAIMNLNRQAPMPDDGYEPLYLRGGVTGWAADENFKLTTTDGNYYSAYYEAGSEVEITGAFKIGSGTEDWTPYNFGGNFLVQAGENYILVQDGGNLEVDGKILASRIEFFMESKTFKITGEAQENKFDVTTDQGVSLVTYVGEEITFMPLTFTQNGTYSGSYTVVDPEFTLKVAGDGNFNTIDYGTNGTPLTLATPYTLHKNSFGSIAIADDIQVGDVLDVVVSIAEDWITANMLVTKKAVTPDPGPEPEPEPDTYTPIYVMGGINGWAADDNYKLTSTDGNYYVATYPAGSEVEISGAFKVADENWKIYNFGGAWEIEAGKEYVLVSGGGNLEAAGKIMASKIEFTVSTATLVITGTTEENLFDITTDQGISLVQFLGTEPTYVQLSFAGNGVYAGTYTTVAPAGQFGLKVGGLDNFNTIDFGYNGDVIYLDQPYQLVKSENLASIVDQAGWIVGDVFDVTVTFTENWEATLLLTKKAVTPDPGPEPEPEPEPEPDTYTPIYVKGGINGWAADDNYKLTSTDGNYYVATYPAGSEVEISGSFKLGDASWNIYNYGGTFVIEANKAYTLIAGSNSANLEAAGKIMASKIEFTVSTATLVITGTTEENLFDITTNQGVSLVELKDNVETFNPLTFAGNGVYTGTFTVQSEEFYLKVGGLDNFNTIDFGWNGNFIQLGQPYVLTKGQSLFASVEPADWTIGDVFEVTVTFTEDWTATLLLTKKAVTPDPEDPDQPVEPEEPVVEIKDLTVPAFAEIEANQTAKVTATFVLENATEATASLSGVDADFFELGKVSVSNGAGAVAIFFNPTAVGTYQATLTITSGNASQSINFSAVAIATPVEPEEPVVEIKDLTVPAFAEIEANQTAKVTATFVLENATEATASLSGVDADFFELGKVSVSNGAGAVAIFFNPTAVGTYQATLTITSGNANQSINFSAVAIATPVEPEEPVVEIKDLTVPAFAEIEVNQTAKVTATFVLENATEATASLSGVDADFFELGKVSVSNGAGAVAIFFSPTAVGTYQATLTITSGNASQSINFSAVAIATPVEPEEPVVEIKDLQITDFAETQVNTTSQTAATFVLENATEATASLSGVDADFFELDDMYIEGGVGLLIVNFHPTAIGTYTATLTITSGKASQSIQISAVAVKSDVPTSVEEVETLQVYATDGTIYADVDFAIYTLAGVEVTHLNGNLEGVYIVKTEKGNAQVCVW